MTIKKLLSLALSDIGKMSEKALKNAVKTAQYASRKRIKRLNQQGFRSKWLEKRKEQMYQPTEKTMRGLREQLIDTIDFLNLKSSTVRGAKKVLADFNARINGKMSTDERDTFWDIYHKLEEDCPAYLKEYGSDNVQEYLGREYTNNPYNADDVFNKVKKELKRRYEEKQYEDPDGAHGFWNYQR